MEEESSTRQLVGYALLAVFANDETIDENELKMLEKIALEDGKIDDDERKVLRKIFTKVNKETVTGRVWEEMKKFKDAYNI